MPKGRYRIMTQYMPKVGNLGLDMMYRTCTVQTNLDFSSEADMVKKLRVSLALQPVATALFANSPFTEGKPNGFLSFRSEIWRDTDADRSGMLPWAFEAGMGFERWVDYALDVPMYFVKRGDDYIDVSGMSFRDLFAGKLKQLPGERATHFRLGQPHLDDLPGSAAEALSGDARRRWRTVAPPAGASPAFWVGLLYDDATLDAALGHREGLDRRRAPEAARRRADAGFAAAIRGRTMLSLAEETLKLAREGLTRRRRLNAGGEDETQISRTARGPRLARHDARGRAAREVSRGVGRFGRTRVQRIRILMAKYRWRRPHPRPLHSRKRGSRLTLHEYDYDPNAQRIGMQAAEALGIAPERLLKTLMAKAGNAVVCVLVPSDRK